MKKTMSLLKACFASNMNLFKISKKKTKNKNNVLLYVGLAAFVMLYLGMFMYGIFEKAAESNSQHFVLSFISFVCAIAIIVEGIYKSGSLLFNCKDDDLLLSLPIKKSTILFIRIFKFYLFELLFNALFMVPLVVTYTIYATNISWTFYLTSFVMLLIMPIIPVILSCILGAIITGLSSRLKHKNTIQIVLSMAFLVFCLYLSFSINSSLDNIIQTMINLNDMISKIYYPSYLYSELAINFSLIKLILYVLISLVSFAITIFILSKVYFKINSRLKKAPKNRIIDVDNLNLKSRSIYRSLINKEIKQFFNVPVFIVNAGFGLVLFIIATIIMIFNYDSMISSIVQNENLKISIDTINGMVPIILLLLITATSYMTSITNSVISLEGKNINTLKVLPLKSSTILMSKIFACSLITFPVLFVGTTILSIRLMISPICYVLLIALSFLIPLVSHFIGILVNLKYPKFDAENSAEVVKQSTSSMVAVLIGFVFMGIFTGITFLLGLFINSTIVLIIITVFYIIIDYALYKVLCGWGNKTFNSLSV